MPASNTLQYSPILLPLPSYLWRQVSDTGTDYYLICSNDGLHSQVIVNHLHIRYGLSHCPSFWYSCHGNWPATHSRCLAGWSDGGRRHVGRAWWCTISRIAKEYVPRLLNIITWNCVYAVNSQDTKLQHKLTLNYTCSNSYRQQIYLRHKSILLQTCLWQVC